jgi:hypothetical protein
MKKEFRAAAEWWADQLQRPSRQDNGDGFQSGFATAAAMITMLRVGPLTDDERSLFIDRLVSRLQAHYGAHDYGFRTLAVDYGPDLMLRSALHAALGPARAEQFSLLWPIKTCMWIDPGCVKVAHGYRAEPVQIYPHVHTEAPQGDVQGGTEEAPGPKTARPAPDLRDC